MSDVKGVLSNRAWETLFFLSEAVIIVFFCVGTTLEEGSHSLTNDKGTLDRENAAATQYMWTYYPMWMDIHVMMFIGFGFLMVFLKTHCWTSIGFNYLVAAWAIQCGIVFQGFWYKVIISGFAKKINIDMLALINADFCAAACLISMGALLGKTTFP
jgi:ammonium transporter Rh